MKRTQAMIGTALLALVLSGCGGNDDSGGNNQGTIDDGEQTNEYGTIDHGVTEKGAEGKEENDVGFSLNGGDIEEAADVPPEEKEAIETSFRKYIGTLNDGDVDAYLETLSTDAYDPEEERKAMEELLAANEFTRTPADFTIVEYSETEAQVFTTMETTVKDKESGQQDVSNGRQVTVMTKEDGTWKVKAVHYIGDFEEK